MVYRLRHCTFLRSYAQCCDVPGTCRKPVQLPKRAGNLPRRSQSTASCFPAAHAVHSVVLRLSEDITFDLSRAQSTNTNSVNGIDLTMRNGQVTPIPLGGNVSRGPMGSSLPALPSVPSHKFYDTMEISSPTTMQVKSASKAKPNSDAECGPGGHANIILRMESQEFSIKSRF